MTVVSVHWMVQALILTFRRPCEWPVGAWRSAEHRWCGCASEHLQARFPCNPSTSGRDHGLASAPDINNTSSNEEPSVPLRSELRPAVFLSVISLDLPFVIFISVLRVLSPPSVKMKHHLLVLRCSEGRFHEPPDPSDIGLDWHPFNGIQDWRSESGTRQCFMFHQLSGMPVPEQGQRFQEKFNRQLIFSISYFLYEL